MTDADKPRFKAAFNRLAVAVRLPADQADIATQRIFWDGLERYPIEAIESSARELAHTATFFPKLSEWRTRARTAHQTAQLAHTLPAASTAAWDAVCTTCDDTGWDIHECPGSLVCGRPRTHAAHTFAQPCACRPTNAVYQRRLTEAGQRAAGRAQAAHQGRP